MRSVITGLGLSFLFVALRASAEPTFPGAIQEAGKIPCTPTCLLCHTEIPGNSKNVNSLFGRTVWTHGAVKGHPESMHAVVERLRAEKVDTDGDGKLDVDELAAGTDPNKVESWAEICAPLYGCGAHLAAAPPASWTAPWWVTVPVVLSMLVAMRRQAARRNR
jgi:hypothetical protein